MPTLSETLRAATRTLAEAGIPDAAVDARILLCAAAGIDRTALLRDGDRGLHEDQASRFGAMIARRLQREPVSRILGRKAFWGLDLAITPAVLDPRPDTETVVSAALDHIGKETRRPWRLLDLGTGSGAILCALLSELPEARAWGVERSFAACLIARSNLARCGFDDRAIVVQADWGASLPPRAFDLIVSNPPYIETAVIPSLDADVREHDPLEALDGGADGLDAYRVIAAQLPDLLGPEGAAFLEVGFDQAEAVSGFLTAAGLRPGENYRDLAGIVRVVSAELASCPRGP